MAAVMGLLGASLTALISMLNGVAGASPEQEKPEFEIMKELIVRLDKMADRDPMNVVVDKDRVSVAKGWQRKHYRKIIMLTLISTALSFLMGGLPKLLDFFQDKGDKKHELAMAAMQMERELKLMEAGYAAQARVEEIRTEQVAMETQAQERTGYVRPRHRDW